MCVIRYLRKLDRLELTQAGGSLARAVQSVRAPHSIYCLAAVLRAEVSSLAPFGVGAASASITEASAARRFTAAMPLTHDSFDSYVSLVATTRPLLARSTKWVLPPRPRLMTNLPLRTTRPPTVSRRTVTIHLLDAADARRRFPQPELCQPASSSDRHRRRRAGRRRRR